LNIFSDTKNTKHQGNVGLGLAIAHYTSNGHIVSIPLNDSQDYDLIVDFFGVLTRVQVKTCAYQTENGTYNVSLCTSGGNSSRHQKKFHSSDDYDILFVVTGDRKTYEIPSKDISHIKNQINLPTKYEKYQLHG